MKISTALNLVGQTVIFSPQNKKDGGNSNRKLEIKAEYWENSKRWYNVQDCTTLEHFPACADTYDGFFLVNRQKVVAKNDLSRTRIISPSHPDYKLR